MAHIYTGRGVEDIIEEIKESTIERIDKLGKDARENAAVEDYEAAFGAVLNMTEVATESVCSMWMLAMSAPIRNIDVVWDYRTVFRQKIWSHVDWILESIKSRLK